MKTFVKGQIIAFFLLLPASLIVAQQNKPPVKILGVRTDTAFTVSSKAPLWLELGRYFEDPEGEKLTFEAESLNRTIIDASIVGSSLVLKGRRQGIASVKVTARDLKKSYTTILIRVNVDGAPAENDKLDDVVSFTSVTLSDSIDIYDQKRISISGLNGMQVEIRGTNGSKLHYTWTVSGSGKKFNETVRKSSAEAKKEGNIQYLIFSPGKANNNRGIQNGVEESWLKQLLTPSKNRNSDDWSEHNSTQHKVEILVPENLDVAIDASYGEIRLAAFTGTAKIRNRAGKMETSGTRGSLIIENAFGSTEVRDHSGEADISGQSGSINVETVRGSVKAKSEFSSIRLADVTGDVQAENESGRIVVERISGNAKLSGRFGSIRAQDVGGIATVENKSGSVNIDGAGAVKVTTFFGSSKIYRVAGTAPSVVISRSGSVDLEEVKGNVNVTVEGGSFEGKSGTGALTVNNDNGSIRVDRHKGDLHLTGSSTGVRIQSSESEKAVIRTKNEPVDVEFSSISVLEITAESSDVRVALPREPEGNVDISVEEGEILGSVFNLTEMQETNGIKRIQYKKSGKISLFVNLKNGNFTIRSRK